MKTRHIPFILLAVVAVVLTTATFVEKRFGTEMAREHIYGAWWFIVLWALLAVSSLAVLFKSKMLHRPATLLLHCSFVVILLGAFITHYHGRQGTIHLRIGEPQTTFYDNESHQSLSMPFNLTLHNFTVETYPGTLSPMDFISEVDATDNNGDSTRLRLSMNRIGQHHGYRFYQSGYDEDRLGTVISVSHDPWGIGITYAGYALLFLSMLLLLVLPNEGFRRLLKEHPRKTALMFLLLASSCHLSASASQPRTLSRSAAEEFGNLYVYYSGRICPMQTLARDFTTKLYGKPAYKGLTAEQVLTGWIFFPTEWTSEPIIKVKGSAREIIGCKGRYASYDDFFNGPNGYKLDAKLGDIRAGMAVDNARSINEADEKMNILLMLFNGELLKIYPYQDQDGLRWLSQSTRLPEDMEQNTWFFIKKSQDYMGELAWMNRFNDLKATILKIKAYQEKEAQSVLPSARLFTAERVYNRANMTRPLAMLLLTAGILAFFAYLYYWLKQRRPARILRMTSMGLIVLSSAYMILMCCLRGYVSGHLPLTNGYETMQFMSLCTLLTTLFLRNKYQLVAPFGLLIAGLTLLVSMMGEANPQITPLMPVLASPLLSLHVSIIMLAYALLAFTMLNGITAIGCHLSGREEHARQLTSVSQLLLYPAVFCLAAGIFVGAIWANQSWGRYWGWDPKEVWALITLIVYSIALHRQSMRWLQKPLAFHLYMVAAFLSILMTYFGVNFFLGGMHSYA